MTNLSGIGMTSQRTRERMVTRLMDQGIQNIAVLECMRTLPRHIFLDEALAHKSYEDVSLPIGLGQTLSQPYIVARMTELLLQKPDIKRVLEIGTGSGYQTSVLAKIVPLVYSVERLEQLQNKARGKFRQLGFNNIYLKIADGGFGWQSQGPFDAIMVTCAPNEIPQELVDQLSPEGGRMIIPVGDEKQDLWLVENQNGNITKRVIEPAFFVPLKQGVKRI